MVASIGLGLGPGEWLQPLARSAYSAMTVRMSPDVSSTWSRCVRRGALRGGGGQNVLGSIGAIPLRKFCEEFRLIHQLQIAIWRTPDTGLNTGAGANDANPIGRAAVQ